jgi:hypothetical protein
MGQMQVLRMRHGGNQLRLSAMSDDKFFLGAMVLTGGMMK